MSKEVIDMALYIHIIYTYYIQIYVYVYGLGLRYLIPSSVCILAKFLFICHYHSLFHLIPNQTQCIYFSISLCATIPFVLVL